MDATASREERTCATDGGEDGDVTPLQGAVGGVVVALTLLVAFALLFAGFEFFWVAFPVGFGGLLPAAVALARLYESRRDADPRDRSERAPAGTTDGALATLRDRYARGDIDEVEFEDRLDALLRTESVDDARADAARRAAERERELEPERERDD